MMTPLLYINMVDSDMMAVWIGNKFNEKISCIFRETFYIGFP